MALARCCGKVSIKSFFSFSDTMVHTVKDFRDPRKYVFSFNQVSQLRPLLSRIASQNKRVQKIPPAQFLQKLP